MGFSQAGSEEQSRTQTKRLSITALHSVSDADDIVFVGGNDLYKPQGDRKEHLGHIEDQVNVTGDLQGHTLVVQTIGPAPKTR
jgi:hypothetical protein